MSFINFDTILGHFQYPTKSAKSTRGHRVEINDLAKKIVEENVQRPLKIEKRTSLIGDILQNFNPLDYYYRGRGTSHVVIKSSDNEKAKISCKNLKQAEIVKKLRTKPFSLTSSSHDDIPKSIPNVLSITKINERPKKKPLNSPEIIYEEKEKENCNNREIQNHLKCIKEQIERNFNEMREDRKWDKLDLKTPNETGDFLSEINTGSRKNESDDIRPQNSTLNRTHTNNTKLFDDDEAPNTQTQARFAAPFETDDFDIEESKMAILFKKMTEDMSATDLSANKALVKYDAAYQQERTEYESSIDINKNRNEYGFRSATTMSPLNIFHKEIQSINANLQRELREISSKIKNLGEEFMGRNGKEEIKLLCEKEARPNEMDTDDPFKKYIEKETMFDNKKLLQSTETKTNDSFVKYGVTPMVDNYSPHEHRTKVFVKNKEGVQFKGNDKHKVRFYVGKEEGVKAMQNHKHEVRFMGRKIQSVQPTITTTQTENVISKRINESPTNVSEERDMLVKSINKVLAEFVDKNENYHSKFPSSSV